MRGYTQCALSNDVFWCISPFHNSPTIKKKRKKTISIVIDCSKKVKTYKKCILICIQNFVLAYFLLQSMYAILHLSFSLWKNSAIVNFISALNLLHSLEIFSSTFLLFLSILVQKFQMGKIFAENGLILNFEDSKHPYWAYWVFAQI